MERQAGRKAKRKPRGKAPFYPITGPGWADLGSGASATKGKYGIVLAGVFVYTERCIEWTVLPTRKAHINPRRTAHVGHT